MALKPFYDTADQVPEAVRDSYTERDGKFHLAVEGFVPKARLDEFRENNNALKAERDALNAKFNGVDPEKYRELTAKEQAQRDKRLIDAGKVDELVNERIAAMKGDHDATVKGLTEKLTGATKQLEGLLIDNALRDAATKAGVRPEAIEDVLLRGRQTFRLHEGKATGFLPDGKPAFGKDSEPLSISEWTNGLAERAAHLFLPTNGGGSNAGNPAPLGNTRVSRADPVAFIANLDAIAKGKMRVA